MDNDKLIEKLRGNIADWNEQARLWDARGDADIAGQCRAKAKQWADVVRYLEAKEHA